MGPPASAGMPTFSTQRLDLRPWTHEQSDVDRLVDTYSQWEVARWLGASPRPLETVEQAHTAVDRWAGRIEGIFGVWAVQVRATGGRRGHRPAGARCPDRPGEVEVGWHFHPDSWGRGFAHRGRPGHP